jgi:hypothetical protein
MMVVPMMIIYRGDTVTLFVRLRRTNCSIVRIQLAAFHDGR